jgi:hypothetical protein
MRIMADAHSVLPYCIACTRMGELLADSCLLFVDRQLQLSHDLAQSLQGLFGLGTASQLPHPAFLGRHDWRSCEVYRTGRWSSRDA